MGILHKLFGKKKETTYIGERKLTLKKGKKDVRDYKKTVKLDLIIDLPNKYIIPKLPSVRDQQNIGSCASHSAIGSYEIQLLNFKPNKFLEGSELYHYYNVRHFINGEGDNDSGQTIRDACKTLSKYNMATEYVCPYITANFNKKPSWVSYSTSGLYKIVRYDNLLDLETVKHSVSNNNPVLFGIECYNSLFGLNSANFEYKPSGEYKGGHALLVVGFDDTRRMLTIRNSWGSNWGNKGYFEVSYENFIKYSFDWWTITIK